MPYYGFRDDVMYPHQMEDALDTDLYTIEEDYVYKDHHVRVFTCKEVWWRAPTGKCWHYAGHARYVVENVIDSRVMEKKWDARSNGNKRRDYQRQKVYDAEKGRTIYGKRRVYHDEEKTTYTYDTFVKHEKDRVLSLLWGKDIQDFDGLVEFVDGVCSAEWFVKRFGERKMNVERGRSDMFRSAATAWRIGSRITVSPNTSYSKILMLHEMAHLIADWRVYHHAAFVRLYLILVARTLGKELALRMYKRFKLIGVNVSIKDEKEYYGED